MSKTYAMQMLLAHGPMPYQEIVEVTGWPAHRVRRTLEQLVSWGSVVKHGKPRAYVYELC